jgi:hypothetical protein
LNCIESSQVTIQINFIRVLEEGDQIDFISFGRLIHHQNQKIHQKAVSLRDSRTALIELYYFFRQYLV